MPWDDRAHPRGDIALNRPDIDEGWEIVDNFRRIVVSNRKLLALRALYEEGGSGVKRTWGIRRLVRLAMRKKRISQSG